MDVIDFVNEMSQELGSATNAAAVLLRSTDAYKKWQKQRPRKYPKRKAS